MQRFSKMYTGKITSYERLQYILLSQAREIPKIAVIGGGAAGLMAATTIAESKTKFDILLFEKNAYLGAKIIISGGGRCNVTTGIFDVKKLLENYPRGAKFLMSAMHRFPPEKVISWFENHNVPLKIEEDLRVFPVSNNGKDIVGAMEKTLRDCGAKVFLKSNVIKIEKSAKSVSGKFTLQVKSGETYKADKVIITTGGNAYRQTGSTGDGYAFAKALGHHLTNFAPSLSSFLVAEKLVAKLAGVSFEKAELTLKIRHPKESAYKRTGAFLFTHHGVSGPAIFALSAKAAYEEWNKEFPAEITINFFPEKKPEDLKKILKKTAEKNGKKHLMNFLDQLLPRSMAEVLSDILKFDPSLTVAHFNRDNIDAIAKLLQDFRLAVIGRSAGEEFVTAGGIILDEINTNTMESKICPGLYFAGEILDIDGYTGGFNLQASWATGRLAGEKILSPSEPLSS